MTFYEELKQHLTKKQHVLVRRGNGQYCVFSHITDPYGNLRHSGWWNNKERAMLFIGNNYGYTQKKTNEYAEEENWKILDVFDVPQEQFKKGEVVVIADNAQELCQQVGIRWSKEREAIISKECEIMEVVSSDYYVYTPDGTTYLMFPHSALSYPVQKEETKEQKPKQITLDGAIYRLVE